jgi:hypothetical protein
MNKTIILATCLLLACSVSGQSKKERKKYKVKSTTEWETVYADGKTSTYKSAYEEFDRDGHSTLAVEYAPDGAVLSKQTAKYDSFKNKTEETDYDAAKKKNVRRTFKYNAFRDKTEETEYNGSGTVLKKTAYAYDGDGNKSGETVTDASGTVLRKVVYKYNGKNLKTGKQTFSGQNAPLSDKKWEYEYY